MLLDLLLVLQLRNLKSNQSESTIWMLDDTCWCLMSVRLPVRWVTCPILPLVPIASVTSFGLYAFEVFFLEELLRYFAREKPLKIYSKFASRLVQRLNHIKFHWLCFTGKKSHVQNGVTKSIVYKDLRTQVFS